MSELRELLGKIPKYRMPGQGAMRHAAIGDLLVALVKAVEPGEHTCSECGRFHNECYLGLAQTPAPKCFVAPEPEDTDATIRKLREYRTWATEEMDRLQTERDEAETEVERLTKVGNVVCIDRDYWKKAYLAEREGWAKIKADAALGKLVRGMENDTGLGSEDGLYYVLRCYWPEVGKLVWYKVEGDVYSTDPADALRAIQASE